MKKNLFAFLIISMCISHQLTLKAQDKSEQVKHMKSWIYMISNQPNSYNKLGPVSLIEIKDSSIIISKNLSAPELEIPVFDIGIIKTRKKNSLIKGMLIGAASGFVAGGLTGLIAGDDPENIFSQRLLDQNQIKDFYLEKSKNQNTIGWILLGAGTALVITGGYAFDKSWDDESSTTTDIAGFAILTGVIADLVSIPYFISAGTNKRKAASLSLGYQNSYMRCDNSFCIKTTPALVINLKF